MRKQSRLLSLLSGLVLSPICATTALAGSQNTTINVKASDFTHAADGSYVSSYMSIYCYGDSGTTAFETIPCSLSGNTIGVVPLPDGQAQNVGSETYLYSHAFINFNFNQTMGVPSAIAFDVSDPAIEITQDSEYADAFVFFFPSAGGQQNPQKVYLNLRKPAYFAQHS